MFSKDKPKCMFWTTSFGLFNFWHTSESRKEKRHACGHACDVNTYTKEARLRSLDQHPLPLTDLLPQWHVYSQKVDTV